MAVLIALVIVAALALAIWLEGRVERYKRSLAYERERWEKERELLTFDLELARALARKGRVYLVESADALVDAEHWRPHTFFFTPEKAEVYRASILVIPGALARVRMLTVDDIPQTPLERTTYGAKGNSS